MRTRTIVLTGKKLTFSEAEEEDIVFWASKTIEERLLETERLRRFIWTHLLGSYPNKIVVIGSVIKTHSTNDIR